MVKQIKAIKTKRKNSLNKTIKEKIFWAHKKNSSKSYISLKKNGKGEGKAWTSYSHCQEPYWKNDQMCWQTS